MCVRVRVHVRMRVHVRVRVRVCVRARVCVRVVHAYCPPVSFTQGALTQAGANNHGTPARDRWCTWAVDLHCHLPLKEE